MFSHLRSLKTNILDTVLINDLKSQTKNIFVSQLIKSNPANLMGVKVIGLWKFFCRK